MLLRRCCKTGHCLICNLDLPRREKSQLLLNPVRATPTDTCDAIDFGKEEVFILTEMTVAIGKLKPRKTADEEEIRPEMLKALNGEGVLWLTRVCQVAGKLGKTSKDWQTGVIISVHKKDNRKECTNY